MTLTLLEIYNDVAGQAWSMFDGEVEDKEEFESSLLSSIQKALTALWMSHPFPFRIKNLEFETVPTEKEYDAPVGNITRVKEKGKWTWGVFIDGVPLEYAPYDKEFNKIVHAKPTQFYVKNDKIGLYPIPDDVYSISVDYETLYVGKRIDEDDNEIPLLQLTEDDDILDIPDRYEELFKNCLITLSMYYGIADKTDENSSSYKEQYDDAYKLLLKFVKGIDTDKTIGW